MITIDGSYGEGGGQILRYTTALSCCLHQPVTITNIRKNRSPQGLRPQHYATLEILKEMFSADTTNVAVGSQEITFSPQNLSNTKYSYDIGTAGSITLVYQALVLALSAHTETITINLQGGTDVRWSPSWDYFQYVFLPLLTKIGFTVDADLEKRGYYPKGGGKTSIIITPPEKKKPIIFDDFAEYRVINGQIHIANLPKHIASRMQHTIIKYAVKHDLDVSINTITSSSDSAGVGITLWATSDTGNIGVSLLGEKGISAEEIGTTAITKMHNMITNGVSIDTMLFDQILPYLAIQKDSSICSVDHISDHAKSTLWLLKQFLEYSIEFTSEETNVKVNVKGNKSI